LEPKSPAPIVDGDSLKERLVSSGNFTTSDAEIFLDDMIADGKIVEEMSNKFRDSCQTG
jgi:polyhydroxyalkanoate synthesis regulator phasin